MTPHLPLFAIARDKTGDRYDHFLAIHADEKDPRSPRCLALFSSRDAARLFTIENSRISPGYRFGVKMKTRDALIVLLREARKRGVTHVCVDPPEELDPHPIELMTIDELLAAVEPAPSLGAAASAGG